MGRRVNDGAAKPKQGELPGGASWLQKPLGHADAH